jgi:hypothetical protein
MQNQNEPGNYFPKRSEKEEIKPEPLIINVSGSKSVEKDAYFLSENQSYLAHHPAILPDKTLPTEPEITSEPKPAIPFCVDIDTPAELKAILKQWQHVETIYINQSGEWYLKETDGYLPFSRHEILSGKKLFKNGVLIGENFKILA